MALSAATVYRDYETDGVPSSGPHKVKKADVRQLLGGYDAIINKFTSVQEAIEATIPEDVKRIYVQFRAPNFAVPATLVGGAYYRRISFAALSGYSSVTYFRSADRFMPDGTTDSANGGYWVIDGRQIPLSALGAVESSTADAAQIVEAALGYLHQIGGGTLLVDGIYNLNSTVNLPDIGGDPYLTRVWSSKLIVKGFGEGTGFRAGSTFPANTPMFQVDNPIAFEELLIDGNEKAGVVGVYHTYVTGFSRTYFRRVHFIGFGQTNSKAYRTIGHTTSFLNCNFERCYSAIWVDNYGIGLVVRDCLFNGTSTSFAQVYFGQNTRAGVPQGVMFGGNQFTGNGYAILMRAMYVAFFGDNVFDMSAPGGTNECIRMEPLAFTDVQDGTTVQPTVTEINFHDDWFGAGYPVVGANPPFDQPRGYSIRVKDWCSDIHFEGCQFPQSQPVVLISTNVGADGVGNTNGGIYNVSIDGCFFTDMLGTGTFLMLYAEKVSNLFVGPKNTFKWCTMATNQCADQIVDVPNLLLPGKTPPTITSPSGSLNGWTSFVPAASASTPGGTPPVFGATSGRSRKRETTVDLSVKVPVTTAGTGSGSVRVTNIPHAPKTDTVLVGIEATSGIMAKMYIAAGSTTGSITFYDGTYPLGVNGRIAEITGSYEAAA